MDAFAVCNFLELYHRTGYENWRRSALHLVDQVHYILGRHRKDDPRTGWISGLGEEEARHPTIGGLRIGKWMHVPNRVSRSTGRPVFNFWAIELAKTVHAGFVYTLQSGSKQMD